MRFALAVVPLFAGVLFLPAARAQQSQSVTTAPAQAQQAPQRLRVGGNVMTAKLIHRVMPVYPETAKEAQLAGTVVLHVIVGKDGSVQQVTVISGPHLLIDAATDAVKQWQYEPTLLNGSPVEVDTTVSVIFDLGQTAAAPPSLPAQGQTQIQVTVPAAPIDAQLKANIVKLLDLTHALDMGQNMVKAMMQQMRPQLLASLPATAHRDQIVDSYADKLAAVLSSQDVKDQMVAIYAKHLSADDVDALIQFYQTSAGQHSLAAMPQVMAESVQLGANAARTNVPLILGELCKQYPELHGKVNFCPADKDESSEVIRKGLDWAAKGQPLAGRP